MLNEEKIRLMTKAASYETGEGKKALSMNKFFRGDYISLQLIGAWISFTIAFCLCVGLWAFYNMDNLMENIHKMDLPGMGKGIALLYLSLLGIYLLIQYVVCHSRYQKNRKSLAAYHHILKRIAHIYQAESKNGSSDITSEGARKNDDFTGI